MQISIIGTGAMATLFAARLADVAEVSMIGSWAEAIETIRSNGITIDGDELLSRSPHGLSSRRCARRRSGTGTDQSLQDDESL